MNAFSIRSNEEICLPPDFRSNLTSHNNYEQNTNIARSQEQSEAGHSSLGKYKLVNQQYIDYLNRSNNSQSLKNQNQEPNKMGSLDMTCATYKINKE